LSLDELPQLWNVLRGEMSLVGPRPLLTKYLHRYTPQQMRRHDVLPGITGWAQVHGRNAISWDEKFRLDLWYVDHASLWIDAQVICRTLLTAINSRDVSAGNHATMPEFLGSAADATGLPDSKSQPF
jgi:lipopolysaccharide/colanic/teichoic acid biosynthesis glycosyltransferase